jgi:hypothetical protein
MVLAALTLIEGIRRAPAGTLHLRRTALGAWKVIRGDSPVRMVAVWSPFTLGLLIPEHDDDGPSVQEVDARLRAIDRSIPSLRRLGGATLFGLVIVVPYGTYRQGAVGFLTTALFVLALAVTTSMVALRSIRSLEIGPRERRRLFLSWCWPFSAPGAAQDVVALALRGASQLVAARSLLAPDDFARLVRERAYDVIVRGADDAALSSASTREELADIVAARPPVDEAAATWCRRCGISWRLSAGECPDCHVALLAVDHSSGIAAEH